MMILNQSDCADCINWINYVVTMPDQNCIQLHGSQWNAWKMDLSTTQEVLSIFYPGTTRKPDFPRNYYNISTFQKNRNAFKKKIKIKIDL